MGLDIYFKKVRGGQSATDALAEKREKVNKAFKGLLQGAKEKDLVDIKSMLRPYLWRWEMLKADEAQTTEDLLKVVQEFYPTDKEDTWELKDSESDNRKYYFCKVNCLYGYALDSDLFEDDGCLATFDHDNMVDILDRAKEILSQPTKEEQLEKGEELLPTQSGFFFGSTDYNDYYLRDIEEVRDKFEVMVKEWDDAYVVIFSW